MHHPTDRITHTPVVEHWLVSISFYDKLISVDYLPASTAGPSAGLLKLTSESTLSLIS